MSSTTWPRQLPPSLSGHLGGKASLGLSVCETHAVWVLVTRQGPLPGAGPRPQRPSRSLHAVCGEESSVLSDLFVKLLEWGGRLTAGAEVDTGPEALGAWQTITQTTEAKDRGVLGRGGVVEGRERH